MQQKFRNNGLSIVMFLLFAFAMVGQILTGCRTYNEDQREHKQAQVSLGAYLTTGHFVEAVFENWESEFLQMGLYVILTAFLFQKGSSESNDPDADEEEEEEKDEKRQKDSPPPVWKGGLVRKVYENSLGLSLLTLFFVSMLLHAAGGARAYSAEQEAHGGHAIGTFAFMCTPQFWFQSFQNWQSEFFSIGALVVLSIYLRQKHSPESKPVGAPHAQTGD